MTSGLSRTLPNLARKPRILVCAPSNAATDELLQRIMDHGFLDFKVSPPLTPAAPLLPAPTLLLPHLPLPLPLLHLPLMTPLPHICPTSAAAPAPAATLALILLLPPASLPAAAPGPGPCPHQNASPAPTLAADDCHNPSSYPILSLPYSCLYHQFLAAGLYGSFCTVAFQPVR